MSNSGPAWIEALENAPRPPDPRLKGKDLVKVSRPHAARSGANTINLRVPKWLPYQKKVFEDPHKTVCLAKGRRAGGTTGLVRYALEALVRGETVLWVDVTERNISDYWTRYFLPIMSKIHPAHWKWAEQKKTLTFVKGRMVMRSAERPQSIEGFEYDNFLLNEAGLIFLPGESLWYNTLAPMTNSPRGKAKVIFAGTPKGKLDKLGKPHLFFKRYMEGIIDNPDIKSYVFDSYQNTMLNADDIAADEAKCPPAIRRQEYHGEFINIDAGNIIKSEWWKVTDELPESFKVLQKIISWDTAFKETNSADYSCATVWLKTLEGFICVDMFMDRLNFPDLIKKTQELYDRYIPDLVLIEDKASGQSLIQMFQKTAMPIYAFKIDTDKVTRATSISPYIENHKVQLYRGEWNSELINQCGLFPAGEYDDAVDSMSQALLYMSGNVPLKEVNYTPLVYSKRSHSPEINLIEESYDGDNDVVHTPRGTHKSRITENFWS